MSGLFITFEGNEGSGKSTQIALLAERLGSMGYRVHSLREPGGTPVGEEIRHTLKHSEHNQAMTAETELLLMNASRAQLVREVIRPALEAGEIVLCDRFFDSTIAYQAYGRQLDPKQVEAIIQFAVGRTVPHLTLLLRVPENLSQARRAARQAAQPVLRDRIEEADAGFFERVLQGYEAVAERESGRVKKIDAEGAIGEVEKRIWEVVRPLLKRLKPRAHDT